MKCLYSSRNNSFNQPIFQSKLLELLSRNYKNKKKITMESSSFRHKLSTSKLSHTNSYIHSNSNTNTNPNSIIKQNGNNLNRKNSKTKININSKHKFSMSNDNFNDYKIKNMDIIKTIYTTKNNSKSKNNYKSTINGNNKRSKSKNNKNCIKKEKTSKANKNKNINTNNKIIINLENELSLKQQNQRLKLKIIELQNELDRFRNDNDLLVSQNRNKNSCLSKQKEKMEISNEKKTKKINKLNNNLNIEINNIDNNYPCDYFNIINNTNTNANNKSTSPIHDGIGSNRKIFSNFQDNNIVSYNNKTSRDKIHIHYEQNGKYFTIGNNDIANNSKNSNNKKLNSSKNKILFSMYDLKNIQNRMNKSSTRIITQTDNSYTHSTILNTEKFIKNLKKNKIKEKLRPQQLIYFPNNSIKKVGYNITKDNSNENKNKIGLNKGNTINLFDFHKNKKPLTSRGNSQNKNKMNENAKTKNSKFIKTNVNSTKNGIGSNNNSDEFKDLQEKMKNLYDRAKNLFYNYESFIENNIKIDKKFS